MCDNHKQFKHSDKDSLTIDKDTQNSGEDTISHIIRDSDMINVMSKETNLNNLGAHGDKDDTILDAPIGQEVDVHGPWICVERPKRRNNKSSPGYTSKPPMKRDTKEPSVQKFPPGVLNFQAGTRPGKNTPPLQASKERVRVRAKRSRIENESKNKPDETSNSFAALAASFQARDFPSSSTSIPPGQLGRRPPESGQLGPLFQ